MNIFFYLKATFAGTALTFIAFNMHSCSLNIILKQSILDRNVNNNIVDPGIWKDKKKINVVYTWVVKFANTFECELRLNSILYLYGVLRRYLESIWYI